MAGEDAILILSTVPDEAKGLEIARALVAERLAACVTTLPRATSVYRWEGKVAEEGEFVLLIKTRAERYTELEARLKALHPYKVPEIIALPVVRGSEAYLNWIAAETSGPV
jgi:periplasmic divalent cation tolerance protein